MGNLAIEDPVPSNICVTTKRKRFRFRGIKTLIVVGTVLAMVFSILAVSHCNFVRTESRVLGVFGAAQYDADGDFLGCVSIYGDEVTIDGFYKNSRTFGAITAFLVISAFLLLLYVLIFRPHKVLWKTVRYMMIGATLSSVLIFSIVGSSYCKQDDCRLSGVGILNVFNVFLLASISVMLRIDQPPEQPTFTIWSDDLFTINKDTLASELNGTCTEFLSHEDARKIAGQNATAAADCAASVDLMEMEVVDGEPRFVHTSPSVFSEQPSVQESLMANINVQRSTCFRYMILIMISIAWVLSIVSIRRCTLIMVSSKADESSQKFGMGIFTRAVYHEGEMLGCLAYPEEALDTFSGAFKASRVFGTVAALLMSLVLVCGVLQLFTTIAKDSVWYAIRGMLLGALVFQTLVFVAFRSNTCQDSELIDCEIGSAGMMTILNCLVLAGLAVLACAVPPPANPLFARSSSKYSGDEKTVVEPKVVYSVDEKVDPEDQGSGHIEQAGPHLSTVQGFNETNVDRASNCDMNQICPECSGHEFITVRVEFGLNEKKTVKEITHADGSKTITTTIERLSDGPGEEESTVASMGQATDDASVDPDSDTEDVHSIL